MKQIWKTWTFRFAVLAIVGIILNLTGIDDLNLFIGLNLILLKLDSIAQCRDWISGVPGLWYVLSFVTMIVYGLFFDFWKWTKKR